MTFIQRNMAPKLIHGNLFKRSLEKQPATVAYVAGFPCKAFSFLEADTKLMRDRRAKPFWEISDTIEEVQPVMAILENVHGAMRVWGQIQKRLRSCGKYFVHVVFLDPKRLGAPMARDRIYILIV